MFTYVSGNFVLEGNDELEGARLFSYWTVEVHLKDLVYDEENIEYVVTIVVQAVYDEKFE